MLQIGKKSARMYTRKFGLKFEELKMEIEGGKISPVYLLVGEDAFFRGRAINLLLDKLVVEPSINFTKFESKDLDIDELLSAFSIYPFMSEKRLILIEEFYPTKDQALKLKEFLNSPPDYSVLVISNEKENATLKSLPFTTIVDCGKADSTTIVRWIKATVSERGAEIEFESAKLLADYCLLDMTRVQTETEKLLAYVDYKDKITNEIIELMISKDTDYKIYEMTDCIGKKDFAGALEIITDLLRKEDNALGIISGVYRHFRRLLHVAISGQDNGTLAKNFGIKEYAVEKMRVQAKKFKPKNLKKAVDMLIDADYKIKSGEKNIVGATWGSIFEIMTE